MFNVLSNITKQLQRLFFTFFLPVRNLPQFKQQPANTLLYNVILKKLFICLCFSFCSKYFPKLRQAMLKLNWNVHFNGFYFLILLILRIFSLSFLNKLVKPIEESLPLLFSLFYSIFPFRNIKSFPVHFSLEKTEIFLYYYINNCFHLILKFLVLLT